MSNAPTAEPAGESIAIAILPSAGDEQLPRRSGWFISVFVFTYFGLAITNLMPTLFALALKVQIMDPSSKESNLGLIIGVGALVSVVAMPVAGVLSDRTKMRWGRRKPWLALGVIATLVGAIIIAAAADITLVLVGWVISILGYSFSTSALAPFLAEQVPSSQRGKVGAFGGVMFQLAGVAASLLGSLLTGNMFLLFLLPGIIAAVSAVLYFMVIPDRPATADEAGASVKDTLSKLLFNPLKYRDFAWVWMGKFLLQIGLSFFSTYQLYFLLDRLGFTPETAGQQLAIVGGIGILVATSFAIVGGVLSDRLRRRKVFVYIAALLAAGGLATLAFSGDTFSYAIGTLMVVAGAGMFGSVDLAMASDILPENDQAGRWMSIYNVASNLPGAIAPIVAPMFLMIGGGGNYTVLFIAGAAIVVGAVIATSRIHGVR